LTRHDSWRSPFAVQDQPRRRQAIGTKPAENFRIDAGESIEEVVDIVPAAERHGDVVDQLEQDAISKPPDARGISLPSQRAG
jgi:hypothetical protein